MSGTIGTPIRTTIRRCGWRLATPLHPDCTVPRGGATDEDQAVRTTLGHGLRSELCRSITSDQRHPGILGLHADDARSGRSDGYRLSVFSDVGRHGEGHRIRGRNDRAGAIRIFELNTYRSAPRWSVRRGRQTPADVVQPGHARRRQRPGRRSAPARAPRRLRRRRSAPRHDRRSGCGPRSGPARRR
jgi:hypothetical protein